MKHFIATSLAIAMVICCAAGVSAAPKNEALEARYQEEMHQARYILNRGSAYEYDSMMEYCHYWNQVPWLTVDYAKKSISDMPNGEEIVNTLARLRQNVVKVVDNPEDVAWYLWGNQVPEAPNAKGYDYSKTFDEAGFKPFLVPYLMTDQKAVKGNVIIVAGGGFYQRCNDGEGYPVAKMFNEMGYNAYVLQRRVTPSQSIDSSLDLQRAVRYLKYYGPQKGIAKLDKIVTIGFSGGGMTILAQILTLYGGITPNSVYSDYVCDAVDSVNSDYQVAALMYGVMGEFATENKKMPALFLCAGANDNKVPFVNSINLFQTARKKRLGRGAVHSLCDGSRLRRGHSRL